MPDEKDPAGGNADNEIRRLTERAEKSEASAVEATKALDSYLKRDAARAALKGKVEDPDSVADLITPHLSEVGRDQVAEHVLSEQFAPKLAAFKAASEPPAPPGEGDGGDTPPGELPATESSGFGAGPSPGQANGQAPPPGEAKIEVGSKEWDELIGSNNREAIEAAYKANRIIEPARP